MQKEKVKIVVASIMTVIYISKEKMMTKTLLED